MGRRRSGICVSYATRSLGYANPQPPRIATAGWDRRVGCRGRNRLRDAGEGKADGSRVASVGAILGGRDGGDDAYYERLGTVKLDFP